MMMFNRLGRKINASTKRGGLWCKFVIKMLPHFTEETFISNGQNVLQDRSQECNWRCKNDTTSVGPLSLGLPMVQQRQLAKQSVRNATVGQSNCYPDLTKPTLSNPIALLGHSGPNVSLAFCLFYHLLANCCLAKCRWAKWRAAVKTGNDVYNLQENEL